MNLKKYSKPTYIAVGLVGVCSTVLFCYMNIYSVDGSEPARMVKVSTSDTDQPSITDKSRTKNSAKAETDRSEYLLVTDEPQQVASEGIESNESNESLLTLEDDWCFPSEQLSDKDRLYLATKQQDWNQSQGVAYANLPEIGYGDEINDLSAAHIEPYLEMEINKLESLALDGVKWAMVAYLQRAKPLSSRPTEREVANELLITGATYHAVEYLIIDELAQAKSIFRKTKNSKDSKKHLVNAVAYTMLGLQNYNLSALTAYIGNVSRDEMFRNVLNPSTILYNSEDKINMRFSDITRELRLAREDKNIYLPETPNEIKKLFALDMAYYEFQQKEIFTQLQAWQTVTIGDIGLSNCTNQHLARFDKMLE